MTVMCHVHYEKEERYKEKGRYKDKAEHRGAGRGEGPPQDKEGGEVLGHGGWPGKVRLNLGCGGDIKPGFINADIRPLQGVDVVCDALRLPFKAVFSLVYASDLLEHFGRREALDVLSEWRRVLVSRGRLLLKTPCLDTIVARYSRGEIDGFELARLVYGNQDHEHNFHRSGFTKPSIRLVLLRCGFTKIKVEHLKGRNLNNMLASAVRP